MQYQQERYHSIIANDTMPLKVFSQNKNTTFLNILIRGDIEHWTVYY